MLVVSGQLIVVRKLEPEENDINACTAITLALTYLYRVHLHGVHGSREGYHSHGMRPVGDVSEPDSENLVIDESGNVQKWRVYKCQTKKLQQKQKL